MEADEEMLKAEIEFWRFMIENRKGTVSKDAIERMLNACALAERKLMLAGGGIQEVNFKH
jgi:hypothetical protein